MSWPVVRLKDIAELINGDRSKNYPSGSDIVDSGVLFLNSKNIVNNKLDLRFKNFITQEKFESLSRGKLERNDLVITLRGTLGSCCIFSSKYATGFINAQMMIIRPNNKVDAGYLYYFLTSSDTKNRFERLNTGSAVPQLTGKQVSELEIPLPPLDEQKRIAAILDKADAIRQKRKQAIDLADEFLRSVFLDMFGDPVTNPKKWQEHVLKDITDIRSGVAKGKKVSLDDSVTLPYMRVANVQDGYLDLSEIKQIVVSKKDAKKCQLGKGDVLLTEGGDPDKLGRGYVWNNEIENCIHQNHIFSVRVQEHDFIIPEFLSAQISSQRGKRYFLKVGKQTTGIATINKTVLSDFAVFIPPFELQKKYVEIKNKVDHFKGKCGLDDLNLFRSLGNKVFSGEV